MNGFTPQCVLKNSIWIFGFLILTALTIKDFLPLLDEYKTNNVAIQVEVVPGTSAYKPPRIVVCIPYYLMENRESSDLMTIARHLINSSHECPVCEKLQQLGWDVWNGIDHSLQHDADTIYNILSVYFTQKLIHEIEHQNVLEPEFSHRNEVVFHSALNFLSMKSHLDMLFSLHNFEGKGTVLQSLQTYLDSVTVNRKLDQLFGHFLTALCSKLQVEELNFTSEFKAGIQTNKTCMEMIHDQSVPILFEETTGIWLALPEYGVSEMIQYKFTLLDRTIWMPPNQLSMRTIRLYPDTSALLTNIADSSFSSYLYQTRGSSQKITVQYSVQLRARDTRSSSASCRNENSAVCFVKCTKFRLIERCGCVPWMLSRGLEYDPSLPYCTTRMYAACNLSWTLPETVREDCLSECKNVCEFTSYNWQISHEPFNDGDQAMPNKTEFSIMIIPMITTFAEFTLTVKNTPEQFLSQIGGIVNFYLGFDGLSIVAFGILCVEFIGRGVTKLRRNAENKEENRTRGPNDTQPESTRVSEWINFWTSTFLRRDQPGSPGRNRRGSCRADMDKLISNLRQELMTALENQNSELKSAIRALENRLLDRQRF